MRSIDAMGMGLVGLLVAAPAVFGTACSEDDCSKTATCAVPSTSATGAGGTGAGTGTTTTNPAGTGGSTGELANGEVCLDGNQCQSGFCADGVCCDLACDGECVACDGGTPGTCLPIANGEDPGDECHGDATCSGQDGCGYGTHVFSDRYASSGDETVTSATVSSDGDIVLTGNYDAPLSFGGGSLPDFGAYIAKVSSAGVHRWSQELANGSGGFTPLHVGTDPGNQGVVASVSYPGGVWIERLTNDGSPVETTPLWVPNLNPSQVNLNLQDAAVTVNGGVYLQATSTGSSPYDVGLGPLTCCEPWLVFFGPAGNNYDPISQASGANGVLTSAFGDGLLAGSFTGSVTVGGQTTTAAGDALYLARSNGVAVNTIVTLGEGDAEVTAMTASQDDVHLAGPYTGSLTLGDAMLLSADGAYLTKLDASYDHLWSVGFEGTFAPQELAKTEDGDVLVAGTATGEVTSAGVTVTASNAGSIVLFKVSTEGTVIWGKALGDADNLTLGGMGAIGENVFLAGTYVEEISFGGDTLANQGGEDIFVVVLGP